jgi:hypothetical protein
MRGYCVCTENTMLGSVLLNRELAEVVTFSAVGNTALAATAKNTIFEELIVNITTHIWHSSIMSTPPIWHS